MIDKPSWVPIEGLLANRPDLLPEGTLYYAQDTRELWIAHSDDWTKTSLDAQILERLRDAHGDASLWRRGRAEAVRYRPFGQLSLYADFRGYTCVAVWLHGPSGDLKDDRRWMGCFDGSDGEARTYRALEWLGWNGAELLHEFVPARDVMLIPGDVVPGKGLVSENVEIVGPCEEPVLAAPIALRAPDPIVVADVLDMIRRSDQDRIPVDARLRELGRRYEHAIPAIERLRAHLNETDRLIEDLEREIDRPQRVPAQANDRDDGLRIDIDHPDFV